jgi:hypothetical protein
MDPASVGDCGGGDQKRKGSDMIAALAKPGCPNGMMIEGAVPLDTRKSIASDTRKSIAPVQEDRTRD